MIDLRKGTIKPFPSVTIKPILSVSFITPQNKQKCTGKKNIFQIVFNSVLLTRLSFFDCFYLLVFLFLSSIPGYYLRFKQYLLSLFSSK